MLDEGSALTLGGLSQCPSYLSGPEKAKVDVLKEFRKQTAVFVEEGMVFLLCEYFEHIEEMEFCSCQTPLCLSLRRVP